MKPAAFRPAARADLKWEVRYYRKHAGAEMAARLVAAVERAVLQLEGQPGLGSLRIGRELEIAGLRSWRVSGFPLLLFYFERPEHLDVVRLLGERRDLGGLLGSGSEAT